jgi:RNA polymerase sigma factor (sigma-70 family)
LLYVGVTAGEFEQVAKAHHANLYWFALSLAGDEGEARDLTQQTLYIWATHSDQVRDPAKLRSWLITTLHREFLRRRKRLQRFPQVELSTVEHELADVTCGTIEQMDARTVVEALAELDEGYRAPLTLFYFEDFTYKEIAEILRIPIGTVMSRLARGKEQLRQALSGQANQQEARNVSYTNASTRPKVTWIRNEPN